MTVSQRSALVVAVFISLGCSGTDEQLSDQSDAGLEAATAETRVEGALVGGELPPPITALSRTVQGGFEVDVIGAIVDCGSLANPDWISRLPTGTFVLRLAVGNATDAASAASRARFTRAASPAAPEQEATDGSVTPTSSDTTSMRGTFDLKFRDQDAKGAFVAQSCP